MRIQQVSIIVPVYRVEDYLPACIDSVLAQDYTDFELILVDDGSPDCCGEICDSYAARDSRIKVIHKENGGLSDARNAGIAPASGEYIVFLDSDDFWGDPGALSRIMARARQTGADILNYSYTKFREDTGEKESYFGSAEAMPELQEIGTQLDWLTKNGLYIASACNKLIRRSLLAELPFRKGVYCEDIEWCAKLLLRAESMDFVPEDFYQYRQRSDSIRHSVSGKFCGDLTRAILGCLELCHDAPEDRRESLLRYTAFQFGTFLLNQAMADEPQTDCIERLRSHTSILRHHGKNKKLIVLNIGCRFLGLRTMCRLIRFAYRVIPR